MFKFIDFIKQVFQGKTIYRILFNWQVKENCQNLTGEVLDLAGGSNPSYDKYLPHDLKIRRTDRVDFSDHGDLVVDFNKPLPFADNSVENIFLFNAVYIAQDQNLLLTEIYRILKEGGKIFLASPWVSSEIPEPDDYSRLTYQGLGWELQRVGFKEIRIIRFGERFSAVANLLHKFWLFSLIRLFVYPVSLLLDKLIPARLKKFQPCPLGYFCLSKK